MIRQNDHFNIFAGAKRAAQMQFAILGHDGLYSNRLSCINCHTCIINQLWVIRATGLLTLALSLASPNFRRNLGDN